MAEAEDPDEASRAFSCWKIPALPAWETDADRVDIHNPLRDNDFDIPLLEIGKNIDLSLPQPRLDDLPSLEDIEALEDSTLSSLNEIPPLSDFEDDQWLLSSTYAPESRQQPILSWNHFYNPIVQESRAPFLSDRGSAAYDVVLQAQTPDPGTVLQERPLTDCLMHLSLGRESALFKFDDSAQNFVPRLEDGRPPGHSLPIFRKVQSQLLRKGTMVRTVRKKASQAIYDRGQLPALVSMNQEILSILDEDECLIEQQCATAASFLQVQAHLTKLAPVTEELYRLQKKGSSLQSEKDLLAFVLSAIAEKEDQPGALGQMLQRILDAVSAHWRLSLSNSIGIGSLASSANVPELPSFMGGQDLGLVEGCQQQLEVLKKHVPEHPLCNRATTRHDELQWQWTWEGASAILDKAQAHEKNLQSLLCQLDSQKSVESTKSDLRGTKQREPSPRQSVEEAFSFQHQYSTTATSNSMAFEPIPLALAADATHSIGKPTSLVERPPISLLPSLSFGPFIKAQARLLDQACLRLLVGKGLRRQVELLHRYFLMTDGIFVCRLTNALFDYDSSEPVAQDQYHFRQTTGLKLGRRELWPPTGTELRLALMGVISETLHPHNSPRSDNLFKDEVPGGLSFALRELSDEALKESTDLQSIYALDTIYALDFLRLQYRAPSPLDIVITKDSLDKYDTIFQLLLRLKRTEFVVHGLHNDLRPNAAAARLASSWNSVLRFRAESSHFISSLTEFVRDSVAASQRKLQSRLDEADTLAIAETDSRLTGTYVTDLRRFHDAVLDNLLLTLLLRKRQREVMHLLEQILSLILRLARRCDMMLSSEQVAASESEAFRQEHRDLRRKVLAFVQVVRHLAERRGAGGTNTAPHADAGQKGEYGENTLHQLLLKLEMNGFYHET